MIEVPGLKTIAAYAQAVRAASPTIDVRARQAFNNLETVLRTEVADSTWSRTSTFLSPMSPTLRDHRYTSRLKSAIPSAEGPSRSSEQEDDSGLPQLSAIPFANYCISCQNAMENQRLQPHAACVQQHESLSRQSE